MNCPAPFLPAITAKIHLSYIPGLYLPVDPIPSCSSFTMTPACSISQLGQTRCGVRPHLMLALEQVLMESGLGVKMPLLTSPRSFPSLHRRAISGPYPVSFPSSRDLHPTFGVFVLPLDVPFLFLNSHHDQF